MATLPARTGQDKPVFIPPKRRTASGKSSANTPTRSMYGDQILLVQVLITFYQLLPNIFMMINGLYGGRGVGGVEERESFIKKSPSLI